jgi:hypothetical protein
VSTVKKIISINLILSLAAIASFVAKAKWGYGFHEGV